ncbi:MAG: hypothetical protein ACI9R3_001746 [Verrucomicrobiales bacterium]|jgi:hypothetical protein
MSIPTDEQFAAQPKTKLDTVIAQGPDGEIYAIPLDVAKQHVIQEDHPPLITPDKMNLSNPEEDQGEVEGHHAAVLSDGSVGYHADWAYGRYCWHYDGCWYTGLHRHPFGWTCYLAADRDG